MLRVVQDVVANECLVFRAVVDAKVFGLEASEDGGHGSGGTRTRECIFRYARHLSGDKERGSDKSCAWQLGACQKVTFDDAK